MKHVPFTTRHYPSKKHHCKTNSSSSTTPSFCTICGLYINTSTIPQPFSSVRPHNYPHIEIQTCRPLSIFKTMVKKSLKNRFYNKNAFHKDFRNHLVKWIKGISTKLDFCSSTLHLAVALLDAILTKYILEEEQVRILTFMVLYSAAKIEDNDKKLPTLKSVVNLFEGEFTIENFKTCELTILKAMSFNLNIVTPFKFVAFMIYRGAIFKEDFKSKDQKIILEFVKEGFSYFTDILLEASLMNYSLNEFSSLVIACCIIALARKFINCNEIWPVQLKSLTNIDFSDLSTGLVLLEATAVKNMGERLKTFNIKYWREKCLIGDCEVKEKVIPENTVCYKENESLFVNKRVRLKSEDLSSTLDKLSPAERKISFS